MTNPPVAASTDDSEKLSLSTKLAYGAGDAGSGITVTILTFSLMVFFTNVAGLDPRTAGNILAIGKVWDAINDPIVGVMSDRTQSRWGRRRPWMIFGAIPFGLFFFLQWLVPQFTSDPAANKVWLFWYYVLVSILFNTAFTAVNLPYTALTPELTKDYNERTSLNSFRFAFSIGGSILSLLLGLVIFNIVTDPIQEYVVLGAVCAILSVFPIYWCVWGTRERYTVDAEPSLPILEQIKIVLSNRPFLYVIGIYLCSWLAFQLTATILPYFVVNRMEMGSYFPIALAVQGVAIVMLFVWSAVSKRQGKRTVYFLGMSLWIIAQGGLFFLQPGQTLLLYVLAAMAGVGVATAYLVPWSMLPDVIELDELRTGQRREGIFYAFLVFLQKISLFLALFIVGQALGQAGFVEATPGQSPPPQPESAIEAIRWMIGPIPTVVLILGLVLAYFYPITREVHAEILLKLRQRREAQTPSEG
ncbi:MFS transporter [Oscillatoria sp. FACHB-1407]|uniref:MFS transporter n=1 Tax=Oscillatoria sp. FACHB-1407 TaxID=2692847 RepID=UPI001682B4D4|nr:MFS transporter [Oscillatoria sp. FACHB-1407]MBD2459971.1 MFS transporter [Oscillatoria sp. FACHB-1407]